MSKYFTPYEIAAHVRAVENQVDEMYRAQAEEQHQQAIAAWINDPENQAVINSDPTVRALRANPNNWDRVRVPGEIPPAVQPAPPPPPPAPPVQMIGFTNESKSPYVTTPEVDHTRPFMSRAEQERRKPWLRDQPVQVSKIIDPIAGRRIN
jgi:hypothetical protein